MLILFETHFKEHLKPCELMATLNDELWRTGQGKVVHELPSVKHTKQKSPSY